jgi:hypothetical protein
LLDAERKTEELGAKRGQAWLDLMRKIVMHRFMRPRKTLTLSLIETGEE